MKPTAQQQALADAIEIVASKLEPKIKAAFIAAIDKTRGSVNVPELTAALEAGNMAAVFDLLQMDSLAHNLGEVSDHLQTAYATGGRTMATMLGAGYLSQPIEVRFNVLNPDVVAWLKQYTLGLIQQVTDETRESIKAIVVSGLRDGIHPTTMAREIRDVIGLTQRQSQAVANFRSMLETDNPEALTRMLRDKRFDQSIINSISGKKALTQDKIDLMVERYRARYVKLRAETIARTEAMRALNEGQHQTLAQATQGGLLQGSTLRRYWLVSRDERLCRVCGAIPALNPNGVGLGEAFRTPNGSFVNPPGVHPCCRCTVFFRLETGNKWLDALNPAPAITPNVIGDRLTTLGEDYTGGRF